MVVAQRRRANKKVETLRIWMTDEDGKQKRKRELAGDLVSR